MPRINSLLTKYCQIFGYSSCTNLTLVDTFFLAAVGLLMVLAIASLLKWFYMGISVMALIPVCIVFMFLQRYLVTGLTAGTVKE